MYICTLKYIHLTNQNIKNTIRWGIIIASLTIVSLILWNTYQFFQRFKEEERIKMEILASAYKSINSDLNAKVSALELQIIESNNSIPMIVTDEQGVITSNVNLDENKKARNKNYLQEQLTIMKAQNKPLLVQTVLPNAVRKDYIYYKDSKILTNLKYYPLALLFILFLFSIIIFLFTKTNKIAAQNQLWTGMAKETAHQIGTPLTSLLGWIAILREDKEKSLIADEIEKDVERLEIIANRFSKIGSETPLVTQNIVSITKKSIAYLKSRSSQQIQYTFQSSSDEIKVQTNPELFGWVIENLVKNALDATQGKGKIDIDIRQSGSSIVLKITDSGKGIPNKLFKRIFEPGYTTKKRGWGIGLSLSKRIIEKFHGGKIYVLESELGKGTTFCIKLPIA